MRRALGPGDRLEGAKASSEGLNSFLEVLQVLMNIMTVHNPQARVLEPGEVVDICCLF